MEFEDCRPGQASFFRKIDSVWGDLTPKHTINRICTIMRFLKAESLLVEELDSAAPEWNRFQQERLAISVRLGAEFRKIEVSKFSFFRKKIRDKSALVDFAKAAKNGTEDAFLGYAIVVNITVARGVWSYIFESIVRELGTWENNSRWQPLPYHYLHVKKRFICRAADQSYEIAGTYFRQQNGITNVCAHACATMMLNNASLPVGIVTAEDLNQHLDFDHINRKFRINENCIGRTEDLPAGPDIPQLRTIFRHYGYEPHLLEFDDINKRRKFRSFLYGFVESGFPALLTFGSHEGSTEEVGHVVPVVGHTLNLNSWLPVTGSYAVGNWSEKHHSPLGWIDDLIIHDDNFGMQYSLPAHAFKPAENPDKEDNLTPREALGIFPQSYNVQMLGNVAESIAASVVRTMAEKTQGKWFDGNYYTKRLWSERSQALRRTTIFRSVLVKWDDYLKSISSGNNISADTGEFLAQIHSRNLTHVWLVEVTEPDLFVGNQSKIADVILNPHLKPTVRNEGRADEERALPDGAVLMVRMPQHTLVPEPGMRKWQIISGWPVSGHIPLYCHAIAFTP